jgi:hypothetical protein
MKNITFATIVLATVVSGSAFAQKQGEDKEKQCGNQVEATIAGIETAAPGKKGSLNGVTVDQIRQIQKAGGNCMALDAIRRARGF